MKTKEEIKDLADIYIVERLFALGHDYNEDTRSGYIKGYTQCQKDMLHNQTVTRFEVIDENGRVYVAKDCKVELSYQDDGRTLKVFIKSINT